MKTLLLLLLPFVGMCQKPKSEIDLLSIRLSVLFAGYKEYCYADSSQTKDHSGCQTHVTDGNWSSCVDWNGKYVFIHRQPTFEGFMEYVEKITSK